MKPLSEIQRYKNIPKKEKFANNIANNSQKSKR